jgi:hypothetical protein
VDRFLTELELVRPQTGQVKINVDAVARDDRGMSLGASSAMILEEGVTDPARDSRGD